jgi:hypothetical protein
MSAMGAGPLVVEMGAEVQTFALRAAVAAAGVFAFIGSVDALPRASAEGPECVATPAVQCAQQAQALLPDPHAGKHLTLSCHPAGIFGQSCTQHWVP